jgi:hypothetical protein
MKNNKCPVPFSTPVRDKKDSLNQLKDEEFCSYRCPIVPLHIYYANMQICEVDVYDIWNFRR